MANGKPDGHAENELDLKHIQLMVGAGNGENLNPQDKMAPRAGFTIRYFIVLFQQVIFKAATIYNNHTTFFVDSLHMRAAIHTSFHALRHHKDAPNLH